VLGAIAGDVIGSVYEFKEPRAEDFDLFSPVRRPTDDSVLTVAIAEAILERQPYADALRRWAQRYPGAGYGMMFVGWIHTPGAGPYQSFGNGSAMRVSPAAWIHDTLEETLAEAQRTAEVTHDHPEGIRGAQAVAGAIFIARTGGSREAVRELVQGRFGYDASLPLEQMRRDSKFDETCPGTVPQALSVALMSTSVEDAIRKAVSLGGDADTLACIAGSIAEALHGGVPRKLADRVLSHLDTGMRGVTDRFMRRYGVPIG
jgi:ADP-ribosylglycohydrolase